LELGVGVGVRVVGRVRVGVGGRVGVRVNQVGHRMPPH
jgi:hypothetical protein